MNLRAAKTAWCLFAALCLLPAVAALLTARQPQPEVVYRLWPQADLVDLAAVHASRQPRHRQRYLRYFDLGSTAPKDRLRRLKALGYVVNSHSTTDEIAAVNEVPGSEGALAWVDLSTLRERDDERGLEKLIRAYDRLGELGSGPAPFPEPYYHVLADVEETVTTYRETTETYYADEPAERWWDGYRWVQSYRRVTRTRTTRTPVTSTRTVRTVALGPQLNRATAAGLAALTRTNFPVFYLDWFVANSLVEPRYHELLGLGDDEADYLALAAADQKTADRRGAQVRGAVLFSEVAHHNRILERTPTLLRYGRGTYQSSFDFKTSVQLQDVLADLLNSKPDAKEVIFSLPNGLLGFAVFDGQGKRLDKADGDVAANRRSRFRDTQVRTAFHCIACHLPDRGWIDVDDEIRQLAARPVTLLAETYDAKDRRRGDRIRQKFLMVSFNDLLESDRGVVEVAVEASTRAGGKRGLTCPETAKAVTTTIYDYLEAPVSLQQLAAELGYPQDQVLAACATAGLDATFVVLRAGRRVRRDQIEAGFGRLATVLRGR